MRKQLLYLCFLFALGTVFFQSCKKEASTNLPLQVGIFYSIADTGTQVAFTSLTIQATSWNWSFGDGKTSTDKSPVHIYASGGYYTATLIGKDAKGDTASAKAILAVDLTPYILLTGGPTAVNGKTWKLNASASNDYFANSDATLSPYKGVPYPLPTGVFGANLGMPEVYNDTYTFYFNGNYTHVVNSTGAAFTGYVFDMETTGGADIVNANGASYDMVTAKYTPQTGATFTYVASENFAVPSVYGPPTYAVTYPNVSTLNFSGTEFIGFRDLNRKVILQSIADKSMTIAIFATASPNYYPLATNALILNFQPAN